jgi:protein-disulfide isomerase
MQRNRLLQLGGVAVAAVVVVGVLIVISAAGGDKKKTTSGTKAAAVSSRLAGIPQQGFAIGRSDAPVTIDEFADLQCPYCREFAAGALPELIAKEVRTGTLRIVFHPLAIIGQDSLTAARVAAAAAQQNKLWQFVEAFYDNQQEENSGYVTDAFLTKIAHKSGVDVKRAFAARSTPAVTGALQQSLNAANALHVSGTPTFFISKKGGNPKQLNVDYTKAGPFISAVQQLAGT